MMFPTRSELISSLHRLRKNACAYGGADRCDCKYGCENPMFGESCGCPELRAAAEIIRRMSGKQYRDLVAGLPDANGSCTDGACTSVKRRSKPSATSSRALGPLRAASSLVSRLLGSPR